MHNYLKTENSFNIGITVWKPLKIKRCLTVICISTLLSCAVVPEYKVLAEAATREELKSTFGNADLIRKGEYLPDVISFRDPSILFTEFEVWEYVATKQGKTGRAYFHFYLNREKKLELLNGRYWRSDESLKLTGGGR